MKRVISQILVLALLLSTFMVCTVPASASKAEIKRNIAIVFDNSGSMYLKNEKAWCRATYAMEVFASMLNAGDSLRIHPMWPIEVNGKKYTMDAPLVITDPSQASQIRSINTPQADGTPIETIDAAINGLSNVSDGKKYLIVLTDGQSFYENNKELSVDSTKKKLAEKFNKSIGPNLNILYLGIGSKVAMPEMNSEYYFGEKASDSKEVTSKLTMMCNRIFARDTLPSSHISGNTINFDISLSKLIVFVQGENVSDVKITGKNGGTATPAGSAKTQYSTVGAANYKGKNESAVDTSLQGMLVTYTDCSAGDFDISYTGSASNVEVYYEPDADLDFVFTDSEGNLVEPESLYKGDYKVQFGLKDAKTGDLISSDLLGSPKYNGKYVINGKEYPITHSGHSGEVPISLDVNDNFTAELTASYLNGYSITKTAKDFGWPEGSLNVVARPAGDLKLEITDGDRIYDLKNLEKGGTYTAKVFYQGTQLTGAELEKVVLRWEPEKSNAEIKKTFKEDHWALSLHYKNPANPIDTKLGKCTVTIYAHYTPDGSMETKAPAPLTYKIEDKIVVPDITLSASQSHFQISKLDDGKPIKAIITSKGKKLTPEEFALVTLNVDCSGLGHTVKPLPEESAFEIKLNSTGKMDTDKYRITATVAQKDNLGRESSSDDSLTVRLSTLPLWLLWLIIILAIILLIIITYLILHIKCLPKNIKPTGELIIGGAPVVATFKAKVEGGRLTAEAHHAGATVARIIVNDVKPGSESYLMTPQKRRKISFNNQSVKCGGSEITELAVGPATFSIDPQTSTLAPDDDRKSYDLKNNNTIEASGEILQDGKPDQFSMSIKLEYK